MEVQEYIQMNTKIINFISEYEELIASTDRLENEPSQLLFGLFGEVGSILTVSKKTKREKNAFDGNQSLIEELGDALWYFSRICFRCNHSVSSLIISLDLETEYKIAPTDIINHPLALIPIVPHTTISQASIKLGSVTAELLVEDINTLKPELLLKFLKYYLELVTASGVSFKSVIMKNLEKSLSRFSQIDYSTLINFDKNEHEDEQLPNIFTIEISQRHNGKTYMKKDGVFIGDPLTDNIAIKDGYRFHDVFHMSYAAILHWSPVFRSLLKNKRKSNAEKDESEDGGRAIVIEEGLSAWIFSIAKEKDFFDGQESLSFDILKNIKQFVRGYEVEQCSYNLFEKAILDGYKIFRELKKHERGIITGSRIDRTITFKPYPKDNDT